MPGKLFLTSLALLLFCSCKESRPVSNVHPQIAQDSRRLISFAPAITEILFALGLGDRVVGVSNFCKYPPEVQSLPRAGGLLDPNLEAIVRLKPDCVIVYDNHTAVLDLLNRLNIPALTASGDNLLEIQQTIALLGQTFNRQKEAGKILAGMKQRLNALQKALPPEYHTPSVIVVVWRERGQGTLKNLAVAGKDQYFSEMIALAGGRLLPENTKMEYPSLSAEGILQINPDLIIEIAPELAGKDDEILEQTKADWQLLPELKAVQKKKIFLITDEYAAIPGPRCVLLAEKFARILSPYLENQVSRTGNNTTR